MRFTSIRALVAAVTVAVCASQATGVQAARPSATLPEGGSLVTPSFVPLGIGSQPVTVVVQLAGNSVAEEQGNAGRKLGQDEKDQIKFRLRAQQDALKGNIESLGGTVLGSYQSSINGIKVSIARDKLSQLHTLAGVTGVRPLTLVQPDNVRGVPLIGAPAVWQSLGLHGENIKIGIIDTGIDYTHANFGGPGTPEAYAAAHRTETLPADPHLFGPQAPRVKGGIDLVGDSYNADPSSPTYQPIPHPDPNPLDCNDHGSHVAGTAAGSGVTAAGNTYTGTYDAATIGSNSWNIGPGVAPKADLYAIRVFGCNGSTNVVVDAIEWAVEHDMDVINMSLGSPFGSKDDPDAQAATNAAKAGIVVVASAGNSGLNPYLTGSPAVADGAISVAANDPTASFPGATISTSNGVSITGINANNYHFTAPLGFTVKVLTGTNRLGCSVAAFGTVPPHTIVVVNRGTCARVAKAIYGQMAGAAAVVMVNNAAGLPPFEGEITSNPDTGDTYLVTIPFLGVAGPASKSTSDGARLRTANGYSAALAATLVANPNFKAFADFTSGGGRSGDSNLKPEVTAPGVSIVSTLMGSGKKGAAFSGTSMASPHVTGAAALTLQAHPNWRIEDVRLAVVNTASPDGVANYKTRLGGAGFVQAAKSSATQVVARASGQAFAASLSFGFEELAGDYAKTKSIALRNNGASAARFTIATTRASGSPHTIGLNTTSVAVPAHGSAEVHVTLTVPAATAGSANGAGLSYQEVAGLIEFAPVSASDNGGVALRVPYFFVPRARSKVSTDLGTLAGPNPSAIATVTNRRGAIAGDADFYAWGLVDEQMQGQQGDSQGQNEDLNNQSNDVRAVGAQSFPFGPDQGLVFAVNTFKRWSNASVNEFDILVDVDGDGVIDYVVVGLDYGAVTSGQFSGEMGSFVFSTRSPGASIQFLATAPTDSSTAEIVVLASQLCRTGEPCLSATNPRLTYRVVSYDLVNGGTKVVKGTAKFNAYSNAISTGAFATVAPNASDTSNLISVDSAEWAITPALGLMIVTLDNKNGTDQAQLINVNPR